MSLFGVGEVRFRTKTAPGTPYAAAGQRPIIFFEATTVSLQNNGSKIEAKTFQSGNLRTKRTAIGDISSTMQVSTDFLNWTQLQFAMDVFAETTNDVTLPIEKRAVVPLTGSREIVDDAITADNLSEIGVFITERGSWGEAGFLRPATTPTSPSAGEVGIDTTNTKLIFNSLYAGAPIAYTSPQAYSSMATLSKRSGTKKYGALEMWLKLYGDADYPNGLWYFFPDLTRDALISLDFSSPPVKGQMSFGVNAEPILYNPNLAVV